MELPKNSGWQGRSADEFLRQVAGAFLDAVNEIPAGMPTPQQIRYAEWH